MSRRVRRQNGCNAGKVMLQLSALKLGIGHLIEGSVRRSEDRIRITAKLIDVASGNQLWAGAV